MKMVRLVQGLARSILKQTKTFGGVIKRPKSDADAVSIDHALLDPSEDQLPGPPCRRKGSDTSQG